MIEKERISEEEIDSIMEYLEFKEKYHIQMNEQQETALRSIKGAILLLAVPGSGKTTVLVNRLGYMIFCYDILPEKILTVTYTVAATNDMKKRFETKFGKEYADRLEFRTINGISQKILQYFGGIYGKRPFDVADKETVKIIKKAYFEITGQNPTEIDIKNIQTGITYVKNMKLNESEIKTFDIEVDDFYDIYVKYNKILKERALIDYDDQMVYALRILQRYPEVLNYFQEKYQYICVDEAQDTSKIQHEMISLLARRSGNLFMVGDEDQSIYGFRAAYPEALLQFKNMYPEAKILLMETNYRSCPQIVSNADKLISFNKERYEKHMKTGTDSTGQVKQICVKARKSQYRYLVKMAENCKEETAILYRNNESVIPLIDLLEKNGILYQLKKSEMTFFSHPVVKDICDFMKLAINPNDDQAFMNIYYKVGIGIRKEAALQVVKQNDSEKTLFEQVAENQKVSGWTKGKCKAISTHLCNMKKENAVQAIYRITHYMGYNEYLEEHNLDRGKVDILRMIADDSQSLEEFLNRILQLQEIIANGTTNSQSNLILSTIHSSKGLEYESVYLLDMMQGILPSINKPNKNQKQEMELYEEERRIYYVGMTRAKRKLFVFTFDTSKTSEFSKTIFGLGQECKKENVIRKAPINLSENPYKRAGVNAFKVQKKTFEEYENGVIVQHKKFGRGVIVEKEKNIAEILFDHENVTRKISLEFTVPNGVLVLEK